MDREGQNRQTDKNGLKHNKSKRKEQNKWQRKRKGQNTHTQERTERDKIITKKGQTTNKRANIFKTNRKLTTDKEQRTTRTHTKKQHIETKTTQEERDSITTTKDYNT